MASLPIGTVTFLFTDIEGSTTLLQRLGDRRYAEVLAEHQRLLRDAFAKGNGQEIDTQGDAFLVAFTRARDAVATSVAAQQALTKHGWPDGASFRVRMGLHTGEPLSGETGYVGIDVQRAARIASAGHGGQILLSDAVSGLAARDLPPGVTLRDLGTHRLKDLQQPERLLQVVHPDLPGDFPPLKSLDARPNNLPRQLTSFIGREKEMAEVKRLLSTAYLVTLTGSGGAGKTRLALQVAADVVEGYRDGVWLVEFAPIADTALVPKTVASALSVHEQPGRDTTETLVDALRPKELLLVLDNCEHLLAACRDLAAALLRRCPQVRILATTREGIGVPGETLWRVPSLSAPGNTRHLPSPEELVLYDAVRLFADRAVEQIAARLDDRFRLLTGGSPIALPRQQTLHATIDWSYQLLSETERVVLRRLSVFAGGWTLEAAEAVCSGDGVEAPDILDLLTRLADKSLVVVEIQQSEARYRFLETVRQYGRDRLVESKEAAKVLARHRNWYLELAEQADPKLRGPEQEVWLDRLETEHDNLRVALEWSRKEESHAEAELRLAAALHWFWHLHGHWTEGRRSLEEVIGRNTSASGFLLHALHGAAFFAWRQGDLGRATELCERGLVLGRELGDKKGAAWIHINVGVVALRKGDVERAVTSFDKSLTLSREIGDQWLTSLSLAQMGTAKRDHEEAMVLYEESLKISEQVGDKRLGAFVLMLLASRMRSKGQLDPAAELYAHSLARVNIVVGKSVGDLFVIHDCIEGLAEIALAQGRHGRAARLLGMTEALRDVSGYRFSPVRQPLHDQLVTSTREVLGNAAFTAAWAEGRAMTLEQAIEYALGDEH